MNSKTNKDDIIKDVHDRQIQFVYYLVGLCVASIGFTISQTINDKLNCSHALIGLSYLSWGVSTFLGFRYVALTIHLFKMDVIEAPTDLKGRSFSSVNMKVAQAYNWQQYLFYAGLIFFIIWYVIQMAKN